MKPLRVRHVEKRIKKILNQLSATIDSFLLVIEGFKKINSPSTCILLNFVRH
jgi:hypothetical protein